MEAKKPQLELVKGEAKVKGWVKRFIWPFARGDSRKVHHVLSENAPYARDLIEHEGGKK